MDRRIAKITLYQPMDGDKVQSWLTAGDRLYVDVERTYPMKNIPTALVAVFPDQFPVEYKNALALVVDACAWVHAAGSYMYGIKMAANKQFTVDGALWSGTDITTKTPVPDGTVLYAEFTTPGLPVSVKTVVALPYNQAVSPDDMVKLNDSGITFQGGATGTSFRVVGKSAFTVRFFQPGDSSVNYVIDFDKENQIIQ